MPNNKSSLAARKFMAFIYGLAHFAGMAVRQPRLFIALFPRKVYSLLPFPDSIKLRLKSAYLNLPGFLSRIKGGASDYQRRIDAEVATYAAQTSIHELPAIFHYWTKKHLSPILSEAGIGTIEGFFAGNLQAASLRTGSRPARFASIGTGNCDLEVKVAKELLRIGCSDFVIECIDINQAMLDRGLELAKQEGVQDRLKFVQADFNTWEAEGIYDGVMAHQSLHHVVGLEHLFAQIHKGLHDQGAFVISDVIGRNGHQRWPEALAEVHRLWEELPRKYTYNHWFQRFEPLYENWDSSKSGFEGIRAQDILPLLLDRFMFEKFVAYGNVTDIFLDRTFGHNFDPEKEWDRDFIDRAHAVDEEGFKSGRLTPTHLFGVVRKEPVEHPFYSRDLDPRACVHR